MTGTEQVTWQELGGVLEALELTPGYSLSTGRAFAEVDGTLLWADAGPGVVLAPEVPGAGALQAARIAATQRQAERERADYHATLTPEQLQTELEAERRTHLLPDPPQWQLDAYAERHGIPGHY